MKLYFYRHAKCKFDMREVHKQNVHTDLSVFSIIFLFRNVDHAIIFDTE